MVWCGQIPLDAEGKFVQGDIKVQTEQCLKNVKNPAGWTLVQHLSM